MNTSLLNDVISEFDIDDTNLSFSEISQGYINDTFLVHINDSPKYILQRINAKVFKNVEGLHSNVERALKKLRAHDYQSVELIPTKTDKPYIIHKDSVWRILTFIEGSTAYNITSNPKIAFEAGRIIGRFHQLLKNESTTNYTETVKNLNYLPFRIEEFKEALTNTETQLKEIAKTEIDFATKHLHDFNSFYKAALTKRVCHNDTKLNNLLFDSNDNGLCLIDLDTIMEGYFHYDFGDAVRTIVSEANEDEKEVSKIGCNLELFETFLKGIHSNGSFLSTNDIEYLPISCVLMPFMHGLRALTDFLNGNIHYKVSYPEQNLDRCRSLFQFAKLALEKQPEIKKIINEHLN